MTKTRPGRAIAALGIMALLLGAVYGVGMSGIPGDGFARLVDWLVREQIVQPQGAAIRTAIGQFTS